MNEERTGKCLRQVEHIHGHMLDVQSNLFIKATQENLKMSPLQTVSLYIQVKFICTIH